MFRKNNNKIANEKKNGDTKSVIYH